MALSRPVDEQLADLATDFARFLGVPTDPWDSVSLPVHHRLFGRGSRRPFSWYLRGATTVDIADLDELEEWLVGCLYVSDEQLYGEPDYWQHPGAFERIRMGDCDDHSLWAWRKLIELGYPASFVAGVWEPEPEDLHTWVVTSVAGRPHLLESTSKTIGATLQPLDEVRERYRPHFSVDEKLDTRAYFGVVRGVLTA